MPGFAAGLPNVWAAVVTHHDWTYVQAAWGDIQINTNAPLCHSLPLALLFFCPLPACYSGYYRQHCPGLPACRLPQGIHILQLQTVLLSLMIETGKYCDTGKCLASACALLCTEWLLRELKTLSTVQQDFPPPHLHDTVGMSSRIPAWGSRCCDLLRAWLAAGAATASHVQHLLKTCSHGHCVAELGRVFGQRKHTLGLQGRQLLLQLQVVLFLGFPIWVDSVNCSELSY